MTWEICHLPTVDSTNEECRRRALAGAAEGLVVIADAQTRGKGRLGRSFLSPEGKGLYLSLLLRPKGDPETAGRLTAWTAVAVCEAIEAVSTLKPGIKWPNDILLGGKKLCGILAERVEDAVILGIGVNISQTAEDFGPELADIAVSLRLAGAKTERPELVRALLERLDALYYAFPTGWEGYLTEYRRRCLTTGRAVQLVRNGTAVSAEGLAVTEDFGLLVRLPDGREETVFFGEVSVRGLLGYA